MNPAHNKLQEVQNALLKLMRHHSVRDPELLRELSRSIDLLETVKEKVAPLATREPPTGTVGASLKSAVSGVP